MANTLGDDKQQQVLALGRLGWPLRRIEAATGVRRETASVYLKAAGIPAYIGSGRTRSKRERARGESRIAAPRAAAGPDRVTSAQYRAKRRPQPVPAKARIRDRPMVGYQRKSW